MASPEPEELSSHDADPGRPRRRRRVTALFASVTLLVTFGVGLLVGWQVLGKPDTDSSPEAEACRLAHQVPHDLSTYIKNSEDPLTDPVVYQVQAIRPLLQAAAYSDNGDADLRRAAERLSVAITRVDSAKLSSGLDELRALCAERGL